MTFPAPTTGARHIEDRQEWYEYAGRWAKPNYVKGFGRYESKTAYSWARERISYPPHQMIRIHGAIELPANGHLMFRAATDWNAAHDMDLSTAKVLQRYAHLSWGSGGMQETDWNNQRAMSASDGIILNGTRGGADIRSKTLCMPRIEIMAFDANNVSMRWRLYYYGSTNSAQTVDGVCYINHPIENFVWVGFKTTAAGQIPNLSFNVEWW